MAQLQDDMDEEVRQRIRKMSEEIIGNIEPLYLATGKAMAKGAVAFHEGLHALGVTDDQRFELTLAYVEGLASSAGKS